MAAAVRIFLPLNLLHRAAISERRRMSDEDEAHTLLGWVHTHSQPRADKVTATTIVVAGLDSNHEREQLGVEQGGSQERVPLLQALGHLRVSRQTRRPADHDKGKARVKPTELDLEVKTGHFTKGALSSLVRRQHMHHALRVSQLRINDEDILEQAGNTTVQLYYYTTPRPEALQYFTLHAVPPPPPSAPDLHLVRTSSSKQTSFRPSSLSPDDILLQLALEATVAADPVRGPERARVHGVAQPETCVRLALDLINEASASLHQHRRRSQSDASTSAQEADRFLKSARLSPRVVLGWLASIARWLLTLLRQVLSYQVRLSFTRKRRWRFVDISATAHQLDTRLHQLLIWPVLSTELRQLRLSRAVPTRAISPSYNSVWNGVWLVANDIILGRTVGTFLRTNKMPIASWLATSLRQHTVYDVVHLLDWLGNWPAGLKLNTELARFFGTFYSGTTLLWADLVLNQSSTSSSITTSPGLALGTEAVLTRLIDVVGLCGQVGGLTFILALCADLTALYTLHIHFAYLVSRALYSGFLFAIDVLFQVFRGKKRNASRGGRVDKVVYELDQRLLGTVFFTLLVFLLPTVLVYYLPFALAEWGRVGVRAGVLEVGLALLNHLPLFGLMLRIKDPARVPAGIELVPIDPIGAGANTQDEAEHARRWAAYEALSVPASLAQIFHGYAMHFQSARQMPGLLLSIITGKRIEIDTPA